MTTREHEGHLVGFPDYLVRVFGCKYSFDLHRYWFADPRFPSDPPLHESAGLNDSPRALATMVRTAAESPTSVGDSLRSLTPGPGRIAFPVRVGVTGHRSLAEVQLAHLTERLDTVLDRVRALFPSTPSTPIVLTVMSALAEGADRAVAEAVLAQPGGQLEAVLPLRMDAYLEDFATETSRAKFHHLVNQACHVVCAPEPQPDEVSQPEYRHRYYEWASHFVVEHSDVLLAVWDGKPSRRTGDGVGHPIRPRAVRARAVDPSRRRRHCRGPRRRIH